jgi:hypothetical protein
LVTGAEFVDGVLLCCRVAGACADAAYGAVYWLLRLPDSWARDVAADFASDAEPNVASNVASDVVADVATEVTDSIGRAFARTLRQRRHRCSRPHRRPR